MQPRSPKSLPRSLLTMWGTRLAVIDIARGQTTGQQFALIIDGQVQFKAVKLANTRLVTLGISCKDAVLIHAAADHRPAKKSSR